MNEGLQMKNRAEAHGCWNETEWRDGLVAGRPRLIRRLVVRRKPHKFVAAWVVIAFSAGLTIGYAVRGKDNNDATFIRTAPPAAMGLYAMGNEVRRSN